MRLGVGVFGTVCGVLLSHSAFADGDPCAGGGKVFRPNKDSEPACLTSRMYEYLWCLNQSGNGKTSKVEALDKSGTKDNHVKLTINGKGVIVKAGGSVAYDAKQESADIRKVSEAYGADLPKICKEIADRASPPRPKKSGPTKTSEKPPIKMSPEVPQSASLKPPAPGLPIAALAPSQNEPPAPSAPNLPSPVTTASGQVLSKESVKLGPFCERAAGGRCETCRRSIREMPGGKAEIDVRGADVVSLTCSNMVPGAIVDVFAFGTVSAQIRAKFHHAHLRLRTSDQPCTADAAPCFLEKGDEGPIWFKVTNTGKVRPDGSIFATVDASLCGTDNLPGRCTFGQDFQLLICAQNTQCN